MGWCQFTALFYVICIKCFNVICIKLLLTYLLTYRCIQTAVQNDAASEDELTRLKCHVVNLLRTSIVVLNGRGVNNRY